MVTLHEELRKFVIYPNTFEKAQSILQKEPAPDGIYTSIILDDSNITGSLAFKVRNNEIVALGENGFDIEWYWEKDK